MINEIAHAFTYTVASTSRDIDIDGNIDDTRVNIDIDGNPQVVTGYKKKRGPVRGTLAFSCKTGTLKVLSGPYFFGDEWSPTHDTKADSRGQQPGRNPWIPTHDATAINRGQQTNQFQHQQTHNQMSLEAAVRSVEQRGNVRVDSSSGQVEFLHSLDFESRSEEPEAVFKNPELAMAICQDLADICTIFGCTAKVEGHIKGGESPFWDTLAQHRAYQVADAMVRCGANPKLLTVQGMPGRMGRNENLVTVSIYVSRRHTVQSSRNVC
jgi:hypothetical protein